MYVIYHDNCPDGFLAAFTCWLQYPNATFIPRAYQSKVPLDIPDDQEIMIVDFSLPRGELIALAQRSKSVIVIDHHKTFLEDCGDLIVHHTIPNLFIIFDTNKCGSMLTWEHLFTGNNNIPRIYNYVQDRDLWQWSLPQSREVSAALFMEPKEFKHYVHHVLDDCNIQRLATKGTTILEVQQMYVNKLVANAYIITIGGHDVPVTNAPILMSEVGEALIEKYPQHSFSGTFHFPKDLKVVNWSLRSKGDFDVSEIAKAYGGGGHKNAAGFIEKYNQISDQY